MDLPRNAFKAALAQGRLQIGMWCSLGDMTSGEILAGCGYDWLLFDGEHSPQTPAAAAAFLRTCAAFPVSVVVRPAWNDPVLIKQYLDVGAQSLLVPYVQNAGEAAAAVRATRYPPEGIRGLSTMTRANHWGDVEGYAARAAEELCLLVQAETAEALACVEEIAAVPGVDGIFIGPADLAASMGYPGQAGHPEVRAAVLDGIRRITAAGKPAGFLNADPAYVNATIEAGALFAAVDLDTVALKRTARERRKLWP